MKFTACRILSKLCLRMAYVISFVLCFALVERSNGDLVTFDLVDVQLTSTQQMTGSFDWTFTAGDFENGAGEFTNLSIPWYSPGISNLNITIESNSIEFSLKQNLDDRGIDISIFLVEPLAQDRSSLFDLERSKYEIAPVNQIYRGSFISGSVVPRTSAVPEPSSCLLLCTALMIVGSRRKRSS